MGKRLPRDQPGCIAPGGKRLQKGGVAADDVHRHGPGTVFTGNADIGLVISHDDNEGLGFDKLSDEVFYNR